MRQVSAQICHPQARFLHPITSQFIALHMLKFISLPFNNLKAILLIQEKFSQSPQNRAFLMEYLIMTVTIYTHLTMD